MAAWTAAGLYPEKMTKGAEVKAVSADLFGVVVEVRGDRRTVVWPSIGRRSTLTTDRLCWVYEGMGD